VFQWLFRADYVGDSGDDERCELFLTFQDAKAYRSEVTKDRGCNNQKTAVIVLV
jgi:hypothetical protein